LTPKPRSYYLRSGCGRMELFKPAGKECEEEHRQ